MLRFSVVPSLKSPIAVNRCELPSATPGLLGVIVSEISLAPVTTSCPVPICPPNNAVIVALPGATPVASPLVPPIALTVAIDAGDEVHADDCVRSCELPSPKLPMALNCADVCSATTALAGAIRSETSADDSTTTTVVPLTEPCSAVMVAIPAD